MTWPAPECAKARRALATNRKLRSRSGLCLRPQFARDVEAPDPICFTIVTKLSHSGDACASRSRELHGGGHSPRTRGAGAASCRSRDRGARRPARSPRLRAGHRGDGEACASSGEGSHRAHPLARQEGGLMRRFASPRLVALFAGLAAANITAWIWAIAAFHAYPVLLGTAFLAYSFWTGVTRPSMPTILPRSTMSRAKTAANRAQCRLLRSVFFAWPLHCGDSRHPLVLHLAPAHFPPISRRSELLAGVVGTTVSALFLFCDRGRQSLHPRRRVPCIPAGKRIGVSSANPTSSIWYRVQVRCRGCCGLCLGSSVRHGRCIHWVSCSGLALIRPPKLACWAFPRRKLRRGFQSGRC